MLEEGVAKEDTDSSAGDDEADIDSLTSSSSVAEWEIEDATDKHDQVGLPPELFRSNSLQGI
jgi:hypothetical protein